MSLLHYIWLAIALVSLLSITCFVQDRIGSGEETVPLRSVGAYQDSDRDVLCPAARPRLSYRQHHISLSGSDSENDALCYSLVDHAKIM